MPATNAEPERPPTPPSWLEAALVDGVQTEDYPETEEQFVEEVDWYLIQSLRTQGESEEAIESMFGSMGREVPTPPATQDES